MPPALWTGLKLLATLVAMRYVITQVRRPDRALGRVMLKLMNVRHSGLTDWGLGHTRLGSPRAILDVGCGGGRTLTKLATLAPEAKIVGVDFAVGSVTESRQHNEALIASGRMEVIRGSVADLPVPAGQFDLVTAVETHYYWPDLVRCFGEVRRVLRPGGQFLLIAESFAGGRFDRLAQIVFRPLGAVILTPEQHTKLLTEAGFENVEVWTDRGRGWICTLGVKKLLCLPR